MDFIPWDELIDCKVSEDSLAKLGELVCTAELLWEITFYGYSKSTVDKEAEILRKMADDIGSANVKTYQLNPDDWKPNEEETIIEEKAITEWLENAPEKVKSIIFDFFAADIYGRNEDIDNITGKEMLKRLESIINESSVHDAKDEDCVRLLRSMIYGLDINEQYLLLKNL